MDWDQPSLKNHYSIRLFTRISSSFFFSYLFLYLAFSTLYDSSRVGKHPRRKIDKHHFSVSVTISPREKLSSRIKKKITVEYSRYAQEDQVSLNRKGLKNGDEIPTTSDDEERTRTVAGTQSRRASTDFPASVRQDRDHFRFSSERNETELSVSRRNPTRRVATRRWGCGPSRLRYALARV